MQQGYNVNLPKHNDMEPQTSLQSPCAFYSGRACLIVFIIFFTSDKLAYIWKGLFLERCLGFSEGGGFIVEILQYYLLLTYHSLSDHDFADFIYNQLTPVVKNDAY